MDVNYYLHREQVELMRAGLAHSEEARLAHSEMASLYHAHILAYRAGTPEPQQMMLIATTAA